MTRMLITVVLSLCASALLAAPPKPNIIVILSDDMGWSDLGCYGGEIETPNLDKLAAGGVRFTQFYNTARCCPTRASLLTGLYPHQAGVGHMMEDRGHDGYRGVLNRKCVTIPEVLRPAGYRNYGVGKWHVTRFNGPEGPKDAWPIARGFDRFYGTITGAGSFFDPAGLVRDDTMLTIHTDKEYSAKDYYYTDAISDHAVRYVAEHRRDHAEQPFFLYVAYTAAHWPLHALQKDIAKYRGKYDAGYEAIRAARHAKQKKLGLVDATSELSPAPGKWQAFPNKEWEARCMEVYAAMIDSMDQGIGRIVAELEKQEQLDNTLIFYLQDNGGCAEAIGRMGGAERAATPTLPTIPPDKILIGSRPAQTRSGFPMLAGRKAMPGPADTFMSYGQNWANVSNTPHREYKHWVHEGGISTPLVAHWPKGITGKGELRQQPGHLIDLMATCVDVSGATYPAEFVGHKIPPREGKSLVPAFANQPIEREAIHWEHEGNRAVRVGDWKLVAKGARGKWELYNIATDRSELHDLAAAQPDRVSELAAKWQAWAERTMVLPLDPGAEEGKKAEKKKAS